MIDLQLNPNCPFCNSVIDNVTIPPISHTQRLYCKYCPNTENIYFTYVYFKLNTITIFRSNFPTITINIANNIAHSNNINIHIPDFNSLQDIFDIIDTLTIFS